MRKTPKSVGNLGCAVAADSGNGNRKRVRSTQSDRELIHRWPLSKYYRPKKIESGGKNTTTQKGRNQ